MATPCPNCGMLSPLSFKARDYNRKITDAAFPYFRCRACGLIFLSPIPDDLGRYYQHDYYAIPRSAGDLAIIAAADRYKVDIVRKFASGGRLLEIGPSYGSFLYAARQAGFLVEGIEMDPGCCLFMAEQLGIKAVQSKDPAAALARAGPHRVIALWHVIEHVPEPANLLEAIALNLEPGGFLVIAAPNPEALQFRLLGRFWPHLDAPRHVALIPLTVLTKRMSSLGLQQIWSTTKDQGSLGWNRYGWIHFFKNMTDLRYVKGVLNIMSRVVYTLMGPFERRDGHGSAYTAVFQKEKR